MDKTEKIIFDLGQEFLAVETRVAQLEYAVHALQIALGSLLSPDDLPAFLEQLRLMVARLAEADPNAEERKRTSDELAALNAWLQRGKPKRDS